MAMVNKAMGKMAEDNIQALKTYEVQEKDLLFKFTQKEINELKKLGFTNQEILEMNDRSRPFEDHAVGRYSEITEVISTQKVFYENLMEMFKQDRIEEKQKNELVVTLTKNKKSKKGAQAEYDFIEDPEDLEKWSDKRKVEYEYLKLE